VVIIAIEEAGNILAVGRAFALFYTA